MRLQVTGFSKQVQRSANTVITQTSALRPALPVVTRIAPALIQIPVSMATAKVRYRAHLACVVLMYFSSSELEDVALTMSVSTSGALTLTRMLYQVALSERHCLVRAGAQCVVRSTVPWRSGCNIRPDVCSKSAMV